VDTSFELLKIPIKSIPKTELFFKNFVLVVNRMCQIIQYYIKVVVSYAVCVYTKTELAGISVQLDKCALDMHKHYVTYKIKLEVKAYFDYLACVGH